MQTFQQTFPANTTWELNVPGKYFTTLECLLSINVRFYLGGKLLDMGEIKGLLSGLEVTLGEIDDPAPAFDRVQMDVQAGDTVKIGIGNGQARYNRGASNVTIAQNKAVQSSVFDNLNKSVATVSGTLLAANANRQFLMIQNKDLANDIWIAFGKAATVTAGIRIIPGGFLLFDAVVPTGLITAIATTANPNIVTVEG